MAASTRQVRNEAIAPGPGTPSSGHTDSPEAVPRFSPSNLDRTADPTQDFYRFASGSWIDSHPIPADKSRWSAFDELSERNFTLLRTVLEDAASSKRAGRGPRSQVGDFFSAALDTDRRARQGIAPIRPSLGKIDAVRSVRDLPGVLGALHSQGGSGLFMTGVWPDEKDSRIYAFYIVQGGLSLPDRDYYLNARFSTVRRAYQRHIQRMLELAGDRPPEAHRATRWIMALETSLARASRSRVELRDPLKNYHRTTVQELDRQYPRLGWKQYLRTLGLRKTSYVVVGQPEYLASVDGLAGTVPLSQWKAYLRWNVVHGSAPHLDPSLEAEDFEFFHRRLLGQIEPEPGWRRAAMLIDRALGEALGRLYVERHFPPKTRARMVDLVRDLTVVVRDRLGRVPWMTDATRAKALEKFGRFTAQIGRPRRYRDYSSVRISRGDHLGNLRRAQAFEVRRKLRQVGTAVDRDEWDMTPPTVNAQFDPTRNEIFFPAGILQPPFFDPTLDDPVNFGAIAVVIGHEITHGYDDQGRKYDADGNLREWWSPEDAQEFLARAQRIVDQYSRFEPLPGVFLNGELTMGENIADLGGVSLAFEALQRRLADGRTPRRSVDGFTPEQRFFLSYAQMWRGNVRDDEAKRRITIDPHAPGRFRVNGVLANLPEFWAAFDVPPGAPMRQSEEHRVTIW
ncbi:MAG TPA: M13 family metallopeptidase [Thermoplasmata archaeon]|nr:M13 family metallopeptidase [Thermoplasmata archaeon]